MYPVLTCVVTNSGCHARLRQNTIRRKQCGGHRATAACCNHTRPGWQEVPCSYRCSVKHVYDPAQLVAQQNPPSQTAQHCMYTSIQAASTTSSCRLWARVMSWPACTGHQQSCLASCPSSVRVVQLLLQAVPHQAAALQACCHPHHALATPRHPAVRVSEVRSQHSAAVTSGLASFTTT